MNFLLRVQELHYSYGNRAAVDGMTFQVQPGEIFGLLGANGAGKTTTIGCISGFLSGWRGELSFDGRPFRPARSAEDRRQIGIVPQELAIYDHLTGRENLVLFAKLCGVPAALRKQRVDTLLEFAGLESRQKDLVKTYSGGMKRRLNLAAGLVHQPRLLLLDEPTVGVDPQSRNHLFESILELQKSGVSMLYTTHYMEEAERLCDRIAIVNDGKVIAIGTMSELANVCGDPDMRLERIFLKLTGRELRDEAS